MKQELAERVSNRRKLLLYTQWSQAFKHFAVPVSQKEEEAEMELVEKVAEEKAAATKPPGHIIEIIRSLGIAGVREYKVARKTEGQRTFQRLRTALTLIKAT